MRFGGKGKRLWGGIAFLGVLAGILLTGAAVVNHADAQDSGSTPLPACPPPGSLGPGTPVPGPDNVSWRYIQECSHCLAVTPTATGLPLGPTSTAVMRSFHSDCPQDYVFQVIPGQYQILADNVQESETYGVIFTPHNDGPMLHAAWIEDPQVTWLMPIYSPDAGTYLTNDLPVCLVVSGYEYLCGQFAPPNADIRTMGYLPDGSPYIPHPSFTRPLALGINAGGDIVVSDVRVIYFGSSSPACALPTPTPTPDDDWSKSCAFDVAIPQSGGFTHHEQPVGGTVGGVSWSGPSPLAGYVFYMFTQGADVSIGPAVNGPSFFDANLDGYQFQDGFYCVGSYDACALLGPDAAFTWLENGEKDVASTTYYMPFNIQAADARTIMLDNGYWIARGTFHDCQEPVVTPTPFPTWTPEPPTPVPSDWIEYAHTATISCGNGCSTYGAASTFEQGGLYTFSRPGDGKLGVSGVLDIRWANVNLQDSIYVSADVRLSGSVTQYNDCAETVTGEIGFERSTTYQSTSFSVADDLASGQFTLSAAGGCGHAWDTTRHLEGYLNPANGRSLRLWVRNVVGDITSGNWSIELLSLDINGVSAYQGVTPTPTTTPSPTPTATASPVPSATPTSLVSTPDPDRCRTWEWKPAYPPVVSLGDDFGDDLLEEGECYGIIPGMHISVPDLGVVGDLVGWDGAEVSWDAFGYCVTWVNMPQVSILGLAISVDWFLLPAVAWLLNKLVEMS